MVSSEKKQVRGYFIENNFLESTGEDGDIFKTYNENNRTSKVYLRLLPIGKDPEKAKKLKDEYVLIRKRNEDYVTEVNDVFSTKNNHYFITSPCIGKTLNDFLNEKKQQGFSLEHLNSVAQFTRSLLRAFKRIKKDNLTLFLARNLDPKFIYIKLNNNGIVFSDLGHGDYTKGKNIELVLGIILSQIIFGQVSETQEKELPEDFPELKQLLKYCKNNFDNPYEWEKLFKTLTQRLKNLKNSIKKFPKEIIKNLIEIKPVQHELGLEKLNDQEIINCILELNPYFYYRRDATFIYIEICKELTSIYPKHISIEECFVIISALLMMLYYELVDIKSDCEKDEPLIKRFPFWKSARKLTSIRVIITDLREWVHVVKKTIENLLDNAKEALDQTPSEALSELIKICSSPDDDKPAKTEYLRFYVDDFFNSMVGKLKNQVDLDNLSKVDMPLYYSLWLLSYARDFKNELVGSEDDYFKNQRVNIEGFKARFKNNTKLCLAKIMQQV